MDRARWPSGLDREKAVALLDELQRLQGSDRRTTSSSSSYGLLLDDAGG